jgi:hypothetical protein
MVLQWTKMIFNLSQFLETETTIYLHIQVFNHINISNPMDMKTSADMHDNLWYHRKELDFSSFQWFKLHVMCKVLFASNILCWENSLIGSMQYQGKVVPYVLNQAQVKNSA